MLGIFKTLNVLKDNVMSTEIIIKADVGRGILEECLKFAREVERKLSAYLPDSYVSKINRSAGKDMVYCPDDVLEVIKMSLEIARRTNGLYDPTVGVLTQGLYGFGTKYEKIPQEKELENLKRLVNYRKVKVSGRFVFLEEEGMKLDLGGIAKGWTAQRIAEMLMSAGAQKALVSVGGEVCCFGKRWKIALKNPEGEILAVIETKEKETTITTSGTYERYIKEERNHHILNPRKGKQELNYRSLTLIENGFLGAVLDALATAYFNAPPHTLKNQPYPYIYVTFDGETVVSNNLGERVENVYLLLK